MAARNMLLAQKAVENQQENIKAVLVGLHSRVEALERSEKSELDLDVARSRSLRLRLRWLFWGK